MFFIILTIALVLSLLSAYTFAFQKTADKVRRLLGSSSEGKASQVLPIPRLQRIRLAALSLVTVLFFVFVALVYEWYVGFFAVLIAVSIVAGTGSLTKWLPWSRRVLASVIKYLSDEAWLALMIKNISARHADRLALPDLPPVDLQKVFVGGANEETLREAFYFYKFVKGQTQNAKMPLRRNTRLLDFGCGWGRLLRFFWKDIDEGNLFGCDVNKEILAVCKATNVPGNFALIEPHGKLPYSDNSFDMIVAYSVFTHLPEKINLHWADEIARVSRPGCVFCLTLEPRRFIDFIRDIPPGTDSDWHLKLSHFAGIADELYHQFDTGEIAFIPSNGQALSEVYGDAVVPLSFIERKWSPYFDILTYIDDPQQFWQAALVLQRKQDTRRDQHHN